jgi:hypothetical protein
MVGDEVTIFINTEFIDHSNKQTVTPSKTDTGKPKADAVKDSKSDAEKQ